MHYFNVDAAVLGSLSAFYYYAYAVMQIPAGALVDRYGIRKLLIPSALLVALSIGAFSFTQDLWVAEIARILMGFGSAFAFIGCLKLAANWFPKQQFPILVGLTNTVGVIGALTAEAPLAISVAHYGWRHTMLATGAVGLIITFFIFLIVRDYPKYCKPHMQPIKRNLWKGLLHIIRFPQTWIVAIIGGLMVAPVSGFTELWSIPFLMKAHHMTRPEAAGLASLMFLGIAVGGPIHGVISRLLGRRKPELFISACLALICLSLVIYGAIDSLLLLGALLFGFGFFTSSMLLCFALNTESQPSWASGVTLAFTNMLVMLGGTISQPLIGFVLDLQTKNHGVSELSSLSCHDFRLALSILPASFVIAIIMIPFVKESYCNNASKKHP